MKQEATRGAAPTARTESRPEGRGARQYEKIGLLRCLRDTGMPIAEMLRYAELVREGEHTVAERRALLEEHDRRVSERIDLLRRQRERIQRKIGLYRDAADFAGEPVSA
ncbi:MerR family DNA-binding protein [Thermomonospora cellulosilytica]